MKRPLMVIATASLLAASSASAADLPARLYTKAPVVTDAGYDWSGFYAGINGGYSWGRSAATVAAGTPTAVDIRQNVDGGLGGGQIGYNWQVNRTWVLGVEADVQATGERGRSVDPLTAIRIGRVGITGTSASSTDFPWMATFRGRAGVLVDPSLLLYATGGVAVGEIGFATQPTLSVQLFDGINAPVGAPATATGPALSDRQTRIGWTVGAGLEKKFTSNWSAKLEYLYLDFGSRTYFTGADQTSVSFHDHIFRAGINYAFSARPVVARY
jgi:outer membrane immunogenic protein